MEHPPHCRALWQLGPAQHQETSGPSVDYPHKFASGTPPPSTQHSNIPYNRPSKLNAILPRQSKMAQYHTENSRSKPLTQKLLKRTPVNTTTTKSPKATTASLSKKQNCNRTEHIHSKHESHRDVLTTVSERLQFMENCGSRVPNEAVKCPHKCRNRKKSPPLRNSSHTHDTKVICGTFEPG